MNITQNKWIRFLFLESTFRPKLILLLILIVFFNVEKAAFKSQQVKFQKVSAEMKLVKRIPEMEKSLRYWEAQTQVSVTPESLKTNQEDLVLEGVNIEDGTPLALISGKVYKTGDSVGKEVILTISLENVELENQETKTVRKIYFKKMFQ